MHADRNHRVAKSSAALTHGSVGTLTAVNGDGVGRRREVWAFVITFVGGPLLSWLLFALRSPESITYEVLAYQLLVVIVALVGGLRPAILAAILSGITLDFLFVAPLFTIAVAHPLHIIALALYVIIGVLVSLIVDKAARRARATVFVKELAETDQVRSALLSALSHDLRRPLSAAVAAIGGLRGSHDLSAEDRDELLATADESLGALTVLVTDLLDVSRVQAGVLAVSATSLDPTNAVLAALDELALGPSDVDLNLDADLPALHADPVLLQRVLVNLLTNALAYAPAGTKVTVASNRAQDRGEVRIIDHGVGVPLDKQDSIFQPFQRFGDTDNTTGLGLGLALSKGFTEGMGGTLTPHETPGGGLSMIVSLPLAQEQR